METSCNYNYGRKLSQLSFSQSMFMDDDQNIYIADWWNNRITEWKHQTSTGQAVASGDQLNHPTNVIIDKETNSFIIADCENRRVIRLFRQNNLNEQQILISDIDCVISNQNLVTNCNNFNF